MAEKNLELVRKQICPDCEAEGLILKGPRAGMAINVKCGTCGSEFNITPFGVERLPQLAQEAE